MTVQKNEHFEIDTTHSPDPVGSDAETYEPDDDERLVEYVRMNHSVDADDTFDNTSVTYRVDRDEVATNDPADVTLYRYDGSQWVAMSADHVGTTDTHYRFTADTPGFSQFAISSQEEGTDDDGDNDNDDGGDDSYNSPSLPQSDDGTEDETTQNETNETVDIGETSDVFVETFELDALTVGVNETVTVDFTVNNTGSEELSVSVPLVVDGIEQDTVVLTVPPNGSASDQFTLRFTSAGEYEIETTDISPETLTVTDADEQTGTEPTTPATTPTPTPTATGTPTTTGATTTASANPDVKDNDGMSILWYVVGLIGLFVLFLLILAYRRRRDEEDEPADGEGRGDGQAGEDESG